jgi:hypothetical protein
VSTHPELQIAAGKAVGDVLAAFRKSVNQPGTMFSTEHWLLPKLDQLAHLLSDPVMEDEAQALLDVLHERHSMKDLLEWLDGRPVSWADFFAYRDNLKHEEVRKRADERERRRAAGLDPYFDFKLPDDLHPKISDTCPDCGSSDWKPIAYGHLTEDGMEDVRRGHFVGGGCIVRDAERYCLTCFNEWPTKPDMTKPAGRPEWIQREIAETRSKHDRLSALAEQPSGLEEPQVERAWARIDGSVVFLVSFGGKKARLVKSVAYARLGGAPAYYGISTLDICGPDDDYGKTFDLAALAMVRFERTHQPERHNLYNNWDIVQAHHRAQGRRPWHEYDESCRRERAGENRQRLSKLLKLAQSVPEKLPKVFRMRSDGNEKIYRVQFREGVVRVRSYTWPLELPEYDCRDPKCKTEGSELACAAALLFEFPKLGGTCS